MIITLAGFARDRFGAGMGAALIEAYTVNADGTKAATPTQTTYPSSSNGKWVLANLDTAVSPTGLFAIKESYGTDVRWIEPETVIMVTAIVGPNGKAPLLPDSITDVILGSRTLDQDVVPSTHSGDLTTLLSGLAAQLKRVSGKAQWYEAPAISLEGLLKHAARHAPGGPDAIAPTGYTPIVKTQAGGMDLDTTMRPIPGLQATALHAGWHQVDLCLASFIDGVDGATTVSLYKNGGFLKNWQAYISSGAAMQPLTITTRLLLAAGDVVEFRARKSSGSGGTSFSGQGELVLDWRSS